LISRKHRFVTTALSSALLLAIAVILPLNHTAIADETVHVSVGDWTGVWQADTEDMDVTLRVISDGEQFTVEEVVPVGMGWTVKNGAISGQSGVIDVFYQGVTAQVLVQLLDNNTAIIRSMSCQPDFHVVCTLVRNQQARFLRAEQ
jgi:hypothetical protein